MKKSVTWIVKPEGLPELARVWWELAKQVRVFALHGPMGAGKTTLVHALCHCLGVRDMVNSPTFSLVNEYSLPSGAPVYHIDLYRIRDEAEALAAGIEECIYSGAYCFIEWPERAPGLVPLEAADVWLEVLEPDTRRIKLEYTGGNV